MPIARRLGRPVAAIAVLALAACVLPPSASRPFDFVSRDFAFIDAILLGEEGAVRAVRGRLLLPDRGAPPYPAVVLLHGAQGQGAQEWHYSRIFSELGLAVLAVDSFGPRGVERTAKDQSLVSEASMLADAFAARAALANDTRIDGRRIGLVGFSKGGTVALYAAAERIAAGLAPDGGRFAVHVAYYPWCGLELLEPVVTDAPVLILAGDRDDVTPAHLCRDLAKAWRSANPGRSIELVLYPGARHAFDHPLLPAFGLDVVGQVPSGCRIREVRDREFIEATSGVPVSSDTIGDVLKSCSKPRATAAADADSAAAAERRTVDLLRATLLNGPR